MRFAIVPLCILLILLTAVACYAAEANPAAVDPDERARQVLSRNSASLGLRQQLSDLRLRGTRDSLTAEHVRYEQTIGGVPVFGSSVTVSLPKNGNAEPRVVSRYVAGARITQTGIVVSAGDALSLSASRIGAESWLEMEPSELVYFRREDRTHVLAWKLALRTMEPFGDWLVISDAATGEPLLRLSLLKHDEGIVFDPNPAVTNGGIAPAPDCDNSSNSIALASEYVTVELKGIDPGQGRLKGEYVDLTAPGVFPGYKPAGQANEPSHDYNFGCLNDQFEEVMVYYHIDKTQRHLQSLGFNANAAILQHPVPAHAHWTPGCDAFFSSLDRALHFGDSDESFFCGDLPRTDTAEDGDVIVHEYGHAIHDDQVPGWGQVYPPFGEQPTAIGEGFSDFLAAAIHGDPCLGEYVSFGGTACAGAPGFRTLENDMTFPAGFEACEDVDFDFDGVPESEEPHCGGLLWGGALWDLVQAIGKGTATQTSRDTVLRLALEGHFYLDQAASFDEAAAAICFVDELLYAGVHQSLIGSVFSDRGINSGACFPSDYASMYVLVQHAFSGDLRIDLLVGDRNNPDCEDLIWLPDDFSFGGLSTWWSLDQSECGKNLPPSENQPFWLKVQDVVAPDGGVIERFEVLLYGGTRCVATDTPVVVPDTGPAVYSKVDCSTRIGQPGGTPRPTPSPTPTPPPGALVNGDVDCDQDVDSVDALRGLRHVAGLANNLPEGCAPLGRVQTAGAPIGDFDCDDDVDSVDTLRVLRHVAGLANSLPSGCPPIGTVTLP